MADPVTPALQLLDEFMDAFNARDLARWEATPSVPSVRIAGGVIDVITGPGHHPPGMFEALVAAGWDHSAWDHRRVIHAGRDKVHFDTRFTRYRSDGSVLGVYESIYVVAWVGGRWGVQARSSFAP